MDARNGWGTDQCHAMAEGLMGLMTTSCSWHGRQGGKECYTFLCTWPLRIHNKKQKQGPATLTHKHRYSIPRVNNLYNIYHCSSHPQSTLSRSPSHSRPPSPPIVPDSRFHLGALGTSEVPYSKYTIQCKITFIQIWVCWKTPCSA